MFKDISEAGAALRAGKVSCLELVEESLQRISELDGTLNAFITVTGDQARQQAKALQEELTAGHDRGPLHGIPIGLKDLFFTKGVRTTNGSKIFSDFVPDYDATVVRKLDDAGAISVGKLNMHEIAYGITSNNPHFGPVRNPHGHDHIPGGSSGGSGAAVASGMVFMSTGTDTGGSIRIPAAYCGTVGLKPTFGRVSRYGAFPLGFTLDHMGPLTRTVADAAITLEAIAGYDPLDDSTTRRELGSLLPQKSSTLKGVRIGIAGNFYNEVVMDVVSKAIDRLAKEAEKAGAALVPVTVPDPKALNVIARTILLGEGSAAMAAHMHRRDDIGTDVMALLDQGSLLSAADYINAQRIRSSMQRQWRTMLQDIDVLLIPTSPITAPKIGQTSILIGETEEDSRLATTRFVRGINVLGLPALAIPTGKDEAGLPVSAQLVGHAYKEAALLRIGALLEALH